jgi:hypothetical protein
VALFACLLALAPGAAASNSASYADPAGDTAEAAPDLTAVELSNDDTGAVIFRITIPNRPMLGGGDLVSVLVDADGRSGTGCSRGTFGAEYALDVLAQRYVFGRCVRGRWDFTRPPASFRGSFGSSTLTLRANRRDLGGANGFEFRVGAAGTTQRDSSYDFAPNVGLDAWAYKIVAPPRAIKKPPKHRARHAQKLRKRLRRH